MARRLGLAQALVNDPELLILDEPTSGLDPIGTKQVKDLILELGRRGKTILLTSHLLADVEDVCDRMVILYGGKIRAAGTANELLADSRHTLIRAPRLDEATIRAIDETLHRVQGVGIERVEAPRQTLENLFLDIVERARQEQLATSGAQSGGRIASFLQGDEANAGEATESGGRQVVEALVQSTDAPARATLAQPAAPAAPKGVDASMLDALVSGEKPAQSSSAPAKKPDAPQVRKAADVDQSLIDSLLSSEGKQDSKQKGTEGGA
jgi:ABC-2 type transport system ATP-binding protein